MPSEALSSLRSSLARWKPIDLNDSAQVLPLGISALDAALPGGGLALGGVTELQIRGASGVATSFALAACRAAQQSHWAAGPHGLARQLARQESGVWCAFVDSSASLFAPGATRLGVDLSRLLVTRPAAEAIDRVAVRIAEANLMAVLIIDLHCLAQSNSLQSTSSLQSNSLQLNEHAWQRAVRRLSLAIKSSFTSVLLLTQAEQFQSLPLPTFQRLELTRCSRASFELKVAKERTGRVSPPRIFPCSIFDQCNFNPHPIDSHGSAERHAMDGAERSLELAALTRKVS